MKKLLKVVPLLLVMLFMVSQVWAGPIGPTNPTIQIYSVDLTHPASVAYAMETLFVGINGLMPSARYNIKIISSRGILVAQYTLNATVDGKLPITPMWAEAGLLPASPSNQGPADPNVDMQLGTSQIILSGSGVNLTFPFTIVWNPVPTVWSSDSIGRSVNGFRDGVDTVYATGAYLPPNIKVTVYVMRDNDLWPNGFILNAPGVYVKAVTAITNSSGRLGPVNLGLAAIDVAHGNATNFDIVVDTNANGILDAGEPVDHRFGAGYTVQVPPDPESLKTQLASNGHVVDNTYGYNATFIYPDTFNHDGSGTGFTSPDFGYGVFCIMNPLIDSTDPNTQLVSYSLVRIWVIKLADFNNLPNTGYNLTGLDISDPQGQPDEVTVQRTCSNGCGSTLIWSAPLNDKRTNTYVPNMGYVVIVEKPDAFGGFDNIYDPYADLVDGVLNSGSIPANQGFSVVGP